MPGMRVVRKTAVKTAYSSVRTFAQNHDMRTAFTGTQDREQVRVAPCLRRTCARSARGLVEPDASACGTSVAATL